MRFAQVFVLSALCALTAARAGAQTAAAQTAVAPPDTVVVAEPDTGYAAYAGDVISLPLGVGLRIPGYNRVDGLVLPWGPKIRLPGGRVDIDPTLTYRSNLGAFDPAATLIIRFGRHDELELRGGRETFSNDRWIRSDLINSLAAIGVGSDARNYFRADRGTARFTHGIVAGASTYTPFVGLLHERAWSTGIHTRHTTAPWSILGRTDTLKMRRVNPAIVSGHVSSVIAGIGQRYEKDATKGSLDFLVESAFDGPDLGQRGDGRFTQFTLDSRLAFPTFGTQTFSFRGHAVTASSTAAPPQRFAYLGGAGTLATVDLLALGGDRLLYVEGQYEVPLTRPVLPLVGAPVLSARYAAGSAGIGDLPDLIQNLGVGIGVKLLKAEYHIDPNYRKTSYTNKSAFSVGFSLSF